MKESATKVRMSAGTVLFQPGDLVAQFPIVLRGRVRVSRIAPSGKNLLLYYLEPGETCVLTTACLLASELYAAAAIVEDDVECLLLPAATFGELIASSAGFRQIVFEGYGTRILKLMRRLEVIQDIPVETLLLGGAAMLFANPYLDITDNLYLRRKQVRNWAGRATFVASLWIRLDRILPAHTQMDSVFCS